MQTQTIQDTIKIRDRGQITLPQDLRELFSWLKPGSVIEIEANKTKDEIVVKPLMKKTESFRNKPYKYKQKMTMSWKQIRKNLARISKTGNRKANLTEFLIRERDKRKYEPY